MNDLKCSRVSELLQLYVDQRLNSQWMDRLEAHLAGCANCRHDLAVLEAICLASIQDAPIVEPPDLTERILGRVALYEQHRERPQVTSIGLSWADAVRAGLLASATTLFFVLLSPALRPALGVQIARIFPAVVKLLFAPGPGSIAWAAWLAWISAGVVLTLWLAGSEVRALWRRTLAQHLPSFPQLRES